MISNHDEQSLVYESEDIPFLLQFSLRNRVVVELTISLFVCEVNRKENRHHKILNISEIKFSIIQFKVNVRIIKEMF
jgi:hypothetical protein